MKKLRPHQIKAIKESPNKWGLWFKQRVGKTPTAIGLADARAESALVICPKSLVYHWQEEVKTWGSGACEISVIGRERFRIDWEKLPAIQAIIVDEAHQNFSSYKNLTYKALDKYMQRHGCTFLWLLTGTPVPSSSWSVYSYGKLFGKDWRWIDWDRTFFDKFKMGNRWIPVPKKGTDEKLQKIIRSIGTVIDLKDVAEVADDEDVIETFTLNKEQKKMIKDYFDPLPIVRYTRQHQIEQGVLKSDDYRDEISIPCEKDKRLLEVVNNNEKIIVVCRYHAQIDKYVDILKKTKRSIYVLDGRQKRTASEIAPEAENDQSAIVVIQCDTCVGFSLKSFSTMVFASMSFSFVNYDQMKSRMKSMDKNTTNTYIHFLTEGKSIDKGVYDAVMRKQDFSIELFNNK